MSVSRFDWPKILTKVLENARSPNGDWESAPYQLIHESYGRISDHDDKNIVAVLIVLHEAIQGKHDLDEFARQAIAFCEGRKQIPLLEIARPPDLFVP